MVSRSNSYVFENSVRVNIRVKVKLTLLYGLRHQQFLGQKIQVSGNTVKINIKVKVKVKLTLLCGPRHQQFLGKRARSLGTQS